MLSEPILVVGQLAHTRDTLGVQYVVGGSLASSVYGIGVFKVRGTLLDDKYLDEWAKALGVNDQWAFSRLRSVVGGRG